VTFHADNLSDAVRIIAEESFDLIVLDLMLPYLRDGVADSQAGVELLRHIRRNGPNEGATVLGVSSFPEEVEAFRSHFTTHGVLITIYDEQGEWHDALSRLIAEIENREQVREPLDFLVFVALEEEKAALLKTGLKKTGTGTVLGLNVTFVSCYEDRLKGALVQIRQMGVVASTLDVSIALSHYQCPLICMSGICAGVSSNAVLGQIVVASPAWEYQAGKWSENGFEIAPTQIPLRPLTRLAIEQAFDDETLLDQLERGADPAWRRPSQKVQPKLGPAASGSAVLAQESKLKHIEQQHRKVSAIDMETFGLYYAAHESSQFVPQFFSAKCVVDLGDTSKNDDLHRYGCYVAAKATIHLIGILTGAVGSPSN